MVAQCCVCFKIRFGDLWKPFESEMVDERVTTTYCPVCAESAMSAARETCEESGRRAAPAVQISAG